MTTQWSNLKNYSRALLYGDLKRNRYGVVCRNMTTVASAVLFRSESKGSVLNTSERP